MIQFSEKYNPLFEILTAKGTTSQLAKIDTILISGGRDSGKSFALSTFVGVASSDYNHRILYTRQTMSSTDNSITQALDNRLEMLGVSQEF